MGAIRLDTDTQYLIVSFEKQHETDSDDSKIFYNTLASVAGANGEVYTEPDPQSLVAGMETWEYKFAVTWENVLVLWNTKFLWKSSAIKLVADLFPRLSFVCPECGCMIKCKYIGDCGGADYMFTWRHTCEQCGFNREYFNYRGIGTEVLGEDIVGTCPGCKEIDFNIIRTRSVK